MKGTRKGKAQELRSRITVDGPVTGCAAACEGILRSLPQWFGIEEAVVKYVQDTRVLPTFLARCNDDVVGFLTIKQHNSQAAEIHVMGVIPKWRRKGVGRRLLHEAEEQLRKQGVEYLQVKTLGSSYQDAGYEETRAFYTAMGFRPLEELASFWPSGQPCLLMVKKL